MSPTTAALALSIAPVASVNAPAPALSVVPLQALRVDHVIEVPTRLFNQIVEGSLSAYPVPATRFMAEGAGISIIDAQNRENGITLQVGRQLNDFNNPGIEKGYKVIELMRPAHEALPELPAATQPPSFALREADLAKHNFTVMYAHGGLHALPLMNGGTVLVRNDKGEDAPTRMAVAMKGDMDGIARGYMLATPPQRRAPAKTL